MNFELTAMVDVLIAAESIHPFNAYVNAESWRLNRALFDAHFLDRKGVYCFWWSGQRDVLPNGNDAITYQENQFELNRSLRLPHGMVPMYVGMTAKAGFMTGTRLAGRMVDRFLRFPKVFSEYTTHGVMNLHTQKTGTCGNFNLLNFPERVRLALSEAREDPTMTLESAGEFLLHHQNIKGRFSQEYMQMYMNNYSVSFSASDDEVDNFYSEALAIGYLRPWLNKS